MEKRDTPTRINLDTLRERMNATYMDGDIVIFDGLGGLPVQGTLQMDMIIVLMCTQGKLQLDINGHSHLVWANQLLICPPHVLLDNYMLSPDFECKIIGLSYPALQRSLYAHHDIWQMVQRVASRPIFTLDEQQLGFIHRYYDLVILKLREKDSPFHRSVMQALFQAVFFEICNLVSSALLSPSPADKVPVRQAELLMQRFVRLLAESGGKKRNVAYFADQLCITPKYLSTVCRGASGKTAIEWIHQYTAEVIVQRLKHSDQTIKEIADDLEFPNVSFFGKFVKSRLGLPPALLRRQIRGDD